MTGYESKKAAAQDKLLDDDDTQVYHDDALTIAYQSGYYDGKKAAAQEPTKYSFRAHWEADGCIGVVAAIERLDGGVHLLKDTIDAPQPAQEPVAYLCSPDKNGLFGLPTADKACKDCFPVYTTPPQRMGERLIPKLDRLGAEAGIKQMTPEIYNFALRVRADVVAQWPEAQGKETK